MSKEQGAKIKITEKHNKQIPRYIPLKGFFAPIKVTKSIDLNFTMEKKIFTFGEQ